MSKQLAICLMLGIVLAVSAAGQSTEFFPVDAVKPGLKGTGKTVFLGSEIEEFDVEILGVLDKVGPNQKLILARLSGERVEQFGVFAGMSGSPVYIDGKLLGAVAYAFSFATAPIAGITPIEEMVDIFKESPGAELQWRRAQSGGQPRDPRNLLLEASAPRLPSIQAAEFRADALLPSLGQYSRLLPILTPLNLSGFSGLSLEAFAPQLTAAGLVPVLGGAVASPPDSASGEALQAGSTIAVQLVRGDMEIAASGTVTHVSGPNVYAFGHPFLSVGYTDLPLSRASVLGVIPSLMNSQKISATGEPVGVIRQDRSTGILGLKGEEARLIPIRVNLGTSRGENRQFNYEVITDELLTPFLVAFTVQNSIVSSERQLGGQTLQVKCRISLRGYPEVSFENSVTELTSTSGLAAVSAAAPVDYILSSGFENTVVERIEVDVRSAEETRQASVDKVWQDREEVRPGEEVNLTVFLRKPNGTIETERYPVKIPEGLPPGPLKIMVGDGVTISRIDAEVEKGEFIPKDMSQLVRAINNLKKNDRLYIRLFREQEGAIVAGQGLPSLPPSVLSLYSSRRTQGDTIPINLVVFMEHELPPTPYVLKGRKVIEVSVKG